MDNKDKFSKKIPFKNIKVDLICQLQTILFEIKNNDDRRGDEDGKEGRECREENDEKEENREDDDWVCVESPNSVHIDSHL
jgi:hypothetical protein